jgi:hypothetical protein
MRLGIGADLLGSRASQLPPVSPGAGEICHRAGVKQFGHRAGRGGDVAPGALREKISTDKGGLLRPSLFLFSRVPDAVQRPSRCSAEPGPTNGAQRSHQQCFADSRIQFTAQIAPIRVELFDQFDLPCPPPAFQGMLARAGFQNGIEGFKIDKLIDAILPGKAGNLLGLMFRYATRKIVGDADV